MKNKTEVYLKHSKKDLAKGSVLVSIIIPVYNTKKYLKKCLDSIVNQTLKDIEIICVNDGSTDGSLKILEKYAKKDHRLKIINKENGGAGSARNIGMDIAKGEYLGFVDSDDWIEPQMFETLYQNAKKYNVDISFCNIRIYDEKQKKFIESDYYSHTRFLDYANKKLEFIDIKNELFNFSTAPWHRIYRKSYIQEKNIKFKQEKVEDFYFFFDVFLNAKTFCFTPEHLFNYRIERKNSIMQSKDDAHITIIKGTAYAKKLLEEKNIYNELAKNFWDSMMKKLFWALRVTRKEYKEQYYKLLRDLLIDNPNLIQEGLIEHNYIKRYSNCLEFEIYEEYIDSFENKNSKYKKLMYKIFNYRFFILKLTKSENIEYFFILRKAEETCKSSMYLKIISFNRKKGSKSGK